MAFSKEQAERYARHFVLKEIGVSGQKQLLQSRVLVIGAGALGSVALLYLAAAGVGVIGIADGDRVELSNLSRQIIHRQADIGMLKTESAKKALKGLNPDITIQTIPERVTTDNITSVMAPYDFVLDCTDRFETKFLINDACVLMEKPYSHAGVVRFEGQAMTYVPGCGGCLRSETMYAFGTLPGAINIPVERIGALYELPREKPIYLFCQAGEISGQFAELLSDAGYDACNLTGGYREYLRQSICTGETIGKAEKET